MCSTESVQVPAIDVSFASREAVASVAMTRAASLKCFMFDSFIGAVYARVDEPALNRAFSARSASRLLANQSQHVLTSLEARPPDRVVPGGVTLQTKPRIVRDERAHRFDAAAAKHRTVGSVECARGDRTRQRRGSVFVLDGRICYLGA